MMNSLEEAGGGGGERLGRVRGPEPNSLRGLMSPRAL